MDFKANTLNDESKASKAAFLTESLFRIILVVFAVLDLALDDFIQVHQASVFHHSVITLALSFIPDILKKTTRLKIIPEFRFVFLFFLFISQFLGEVLDFFIKFWWWDKMLHVTSAFIITVIGYIILFFYLPQDKSHDFKLKYLIFATIFAFSFSMMIGTMWEVFEYLVDVTIGLNMQKSGLTDTMEDLTTCLIGTVIPCTMFLSDVKRKKKSFVTKIIFDYLEKSKCAVYDQNSPVSQRII